MSDFDIFLTDEVKQQLKERQEAEQQRLKEQQEIEKIKQLLKERQEAAKQQHNLAEVFFMPDFTKLLEMNAAREALTPIKISDESKHRYVSCIGAQGGVFPAAVAELVGFGKEFYDPFKPKQNNDQNNDQSHVNLVEFITGTFNEGLKDAKNNQIGRFYGIAHPADGACDVFLQIK